MIDQIDAKKRRGEAKPRERVLQVIVGDVQAIARESG
jgi:hypothetical protein